MNIQQPKQAETRINVDFLLNPIRPGLFSRSLGGGGGGLRDPGAKNQGHHQPTEMKLCMSQYSHESMPDAKFESGCFSSFGADDVTKFPSEIQIFTPRKWI